MQTALHLDQGVAVTSHVSQGKTVDNAIVSVPVEAFSQANEAQFYVSMSRARKAMHLITDCKPALREAVTQKSARISAYELAQQLIAETNRDMKANRVNHSQNWQSMNANRQAEVQTIYR